MIASELGIGTTERSVSVGFRTLDAVGFNDTLVFDYPAVMNSWPSLFEGESGGFSGRDEPVLVVLLVLVMLGRVLRFCRRSCQ